jgi:chorismate-pyruvate lyase
MSEKTLYAGFCEQDLVQHEQMSPSLLAWLTTGHLTEALRAVCNAYHFSVLSEAWQSILTFEAHLIGKCDGEDLAWVRCSNAGESLVHARVIAPQETFDEHREDLMNLKHRTIGATLLFNRAEVTRDPFVYYHMQDCPDFSSLVFPNFHPLWLRASVFHWRKKPLVITEIFSDLLPQHPDIYESI